ncbi:MAG TPA: T9SS type A sorting domain-containing protein, partial [Ignavibacteriaceae bacterium]|nr:T9SS type A sorting domain-containing protein [Ignavibacteriaceae bacterium]
GDLLRTLMYDRFAEKYIDAGVNFMANMPFVISNPNDITLDKIVLVDLNKKKVINIQVNVVYGTPVPLDYILFQNYPNPFNPNTSVKFQVPEDGLVTIKIFDMLGQEIATLISDNIQKGTYTLNW